MPRDSTTHKGRHQFKRRFSLQPSFFTREEHSPATTPNHHRSASRSDSQSDSGINEESESSNSNTASRHKVVVMGAAKVGKTSLISQFLYGVFNEKYKRTIEEMHHAEFSVTGVHLTLDILDTSGSYEFPAMRALSISSADAFILVYSIVDASTFEEIRLIRDQIIETKGTTEVPIVVVGNKFDLANDKREVDYETTESVVTVDWENGFIEASAKNNLNVTEVFKELLTQAKIKYNLSPALRRRRRVSLPPNSPAVTPNQSHPAIPSAAQLQHLETIREKHASSGGKRNSCIIS